MRLQPGGIDRVVAVGAQGPGGVALLACEPAVGEHLDSGVHARLVLFDHQLPDVRAAAPTGGDEARTAGATGAGEIVEPIPMIEGITLPGGMWNLHAQMEREPRDVDWANSMERQFETYFASKPALARNFGSPSVLCRTRFCEIQAVGYGPEAFATWSSATEDLRDQPWGKELLAGGVYTTARAPNEQAVVLILMRMQRPALRMPTQ